MTEKQEIKPRQAKSKKYMLVRYGRMNSLDFFEHNETHIPKVPTRVVVKTERGLELGHLVGQACYKAGQFKLGAEQVKEYFDKNDIEFSIALAGKVIRFATASDLSEERHLRKNTQQQIECCKRFAKELGLPMKIVDAENIFGGERIIFYFMAEGRVDFRELVKKLANEYQSRIEMRQIGSRDEAKLLGDVESCGQQCCCQLFLKALKPVNMRMAKMQKATLDPSKISGYCGRLKCCLRYEDQTYTELKKRLPRKNARVKTPHGEGKVVDTQLLTQLVVVEDDNGTRNAVGVEQVEVLSPPPAAQGNADDDTNQDETESVEQ
jgi:cell fate regulator YaaT (PSP1 superfamily)